MDMDKVIPDDKKSINEQGIVPFGEVRDNYTFTQLRAIAKKYKFTFDTPIKKIPKKALAVILEGGDELDIKTSYSKHDFVYNLANEGLKTMIERWQSTSTSEKIRRWAEDFMTVITCPDCDGYRLKKESRHFKLGEKPVSYTHLTLPTNREV